MSLIDVTFYSDTLRRDMHVKVLYPQNCERTPIDKKESMHPPYPVLYLLHGLSGNEDSWVRFTSLERYVRDRGLVVIMSTTDRMFYINNKKGYRYGDFISQELPTLIADMFQVQTDRDHTFIAGASMGGYGAFYTALESPENYGYAAAISGVMDIAQRYQAGPDPKSPEEFEMIFGGQDPQGTDKDLYHLIGELQAAEADIPHLFMTCGLDDGLIGQNRRFYENFGKDLAITYQEEAGDHSWLFWDQQIQAVLDWLPLD